MAAIMMPQQIDNCIKEMCGDAVSQTVAALSAKYGFDLEDANRFIDASELKIVHKRGPSPKTTEASPKGKGKVKSEDKPKRPKTGYLLYADEVRSEVKDSLTAALEDGDKLKPQDVVRGIAAKWKAENQSVRDDWKSKAKTPVTSDDEESNEEEPKKEEPNEEEPKKEEPKKKESKKEEPKKEEPNEEEPKKEEPKKKESKKEEPKEAPKSPVITKKEVKTPSAPKKASKKASGSKPAVVKLEDLGEEIVSISDSDSD